MEEEDEIAAAARVLKTRPGEQLARTVVSNMLVIAGVRCEIRQADAAGEGEGAGAGAHVPRGLLSCATMTCTMRGVVVMVVVGYLMLFFAVRRYQMVASTARTWAGGQASPSGTCPQGQCDRGQRRVKSSRGRKHAHEREGERGSE